MRSKNNDDNATNTVRRALLGAHEALLSAVRIGYERANGRVEGPFALLELAANDEAFAWIRPLSQLIVAFDEAGDEGTLDVNDARAVRALVKPLLTEPSDFLERYVEMMQREPDVVFANAKLTRALAALREVAETASAAEA